MDMYLRFRQKCKEWQELHDKLLRMLSILQSSIESSRVIPSTDTTGTLNQRLEPYSIEDFYQRIQQEPQKQKKILHDMYTIYQEAIDNDAISTEGINMTCYIDFIGIELEMYEAEYQHIEVLIRMLDFKTTSNVWNTCITSLSSQPFLDINIITDITERHNFSYRQHQKVQTK